MGKRSRLCYCKMTLEKGKSTRYVEENSFAGGGAFAEEAGR